MYLSRRKLLGGLIASAAGATTALASVPTRSIYPAPRPDGFHKVAVKSADELIKHAGLGGKVSFALADAHTGEMLESRASALPQPPASTAKVLTSLYALDTLGPHFRFRTRLLATGPVTDGRLEGDLILAGGGDPTLDTDALAEMAAELKMIGVREVSGRFLVWADALPLVDEIAPPQPDYLGYNPAVGGLNLNYNRVHFEWKRAGDEYRVAMDARSAKHNPAVAVARMKVIDRSAPIYTYANRDGHDDWTVARGALGSGGARWLPVRKPALYAGEVFQILARAQGIQLGGSVGVAKAAQGSALVIRDSAPLSDVLRDMLKYSTNLTAEAIGMTASAASGPVTGPLGSAQEMDAWLVRTRNVRAIRMVDHSGLGAASRVTVADMVRTLVGAGPEGQLAGLMKTYPVEERPGVTVHAKTGTLNFVSGLTGFIRVPGAADLAFAVYCSDVPRRAALSEAEMERPAGGHVWTARARALQGALLTRWSTVYSA